MARSHGVHAEQLVLICKEAWRTHPSAREIPRETGTAILTRVISQCIDEFYRTDGDDITHAIAPERVTVPEASLSFMLGPLS
jgi:hypothetical protein